MSTQTDLNKAIVRRYNHEGIAQGNADTLHELLAPDFINRSAPAGQENGPQSMVYFFRHILQPAFTDLRVDIYDQVAEGDKVTTRKAIRGLYTGELLGVAPTQRAVTIDVIDIYRLREGRLVEHWGITSLPAVLAELAAAH